MICIIKQGLEGFVTESMVCWRYFKMYFSRLTDVYEMSNLNKENYKRFRDFPLEMCILVLIFFLFLHLLAYLILKKSTEFNISCGKYIFLIFSHLFYSLPCQYLLHSPPSNFYFFINIWKRMICDQDSFS